MKFLHEKRELPNAPFSLCLYLQQHLVLGGLDVVVLPRLMIQQFVTARKGAEEIIFWEDFRGPVANSFLYK